MRTLATTDAVIDALDGSSEVARLLGCKRQRVGMWKGAYTGHFPPWTFDPLTAALAARGLKALPTCWKAIPPSALIKTSRRPAITGLG